MFGGTVGPNPMKPANPNDPQYYDGIKVRDIPLMISIQSASPNPQMNSTTSNTPNSTPVKIQQVRRKSVQQLTPAKSPTALTVIADTGDACSQVSPASPILKAQLSAPPKQRESVIATSNTSKSDMKSQVIRCQIINASAHSLYFYFHLTYIKLLGDGFFLIFINFQGKNCTLFVILV